MFPSWSVICGFVVGAVIGSFLNMLIYRLPHGVSLINPRHSICPECKHELRTADLFPLLSWLSTRGKCRYCAKPVPARYFYVELLTALLFSALWWQCFIAQEAYLTGGFFALMTGGLVAVIFIDAEHYIIPDELNAYLLLVGIAYRCFDHSLLVGLKGALVGWGLLWGIAFLGRVAFGKDAMGHGDIKMMRGVGFLLGGALVSVSLAIGVVLGLVFGLLFIAIESAKSKKSPVTEQEPETLPLLEAESIGSLVACGIWYLLVLDVFALVFPRLNRLIGGETQEELIDPDWKPSLTTIPFGPYLAAGAIVCMLFSGPISAGLATWWQNAAGNGTPSSTSAMRFGERFVPSSPSQIYRERK